MKAYKTPLIRSWAASRGGSYKATREDGKKVALYLDINGFWIVFVDDQRIGAWPSLGRAKQAANDWTG